VTRIDVQAEDGAVGWLLLGIVIGVILVFWAVFSLVF
jgi:hypothetical protein